MAFWFFMLLTVLLIPGVMLYFGSLFEKQAPRQINRLFGYRTRRSMKNRDTWEFAHRYCGRLWRKWGLFLIQLSLVGMAVVWNRDTEIVGMAGTVLCLLQLVPIFAAVARTEAALKETFDEDGNRR